MSWFFAFAAFAALIILHEYGHFIAAKSVGMQATRFSLFFPPAIFKFKPKNSDTSYEIGAIPLGGYVKITGMNPDEEGIPDEDLPKAYFMQPVWKRVVVIAAGPAMNVLIAAVLIFILYAFVGVTTGNSTKIAQVNPTSPVAGQIQPGDKLVSVNGVGGSAAALVEELGKTKCAAKPVNGCVATAPVTVTVQRGDQTQTFRAVPRYDSSVKRMRLGVSFGTVSTTYSLPSSAKQTADAMWRVTKLTVTLPARIFNSQERKQISGTAGAYKSTQQAFKKSNAETVIGIIALISLSLALINLFPFLPLDGGHIFWALAEKVRGKRIPVPVLERASIAGIALIGMLFLIGLSNDIGRFTHGGFGP